MPNSRRRKFSVQNDPTVGSKVKLQNESQTLRVTLPNREAEKPRTVQVVIPVQTKKLKSGNLPKESITPRSNLVSVASSTTSLVTVKRPHVSMCSNTNVNKTLRSHSSDIEIFVAEIKGISSDEKDFKHVTNASVVSRQRIPRAENYPTSSRQDRYLAPSPHRVKVRSPKRSNTSKYKSTRKDTSLQEPIYVNAAVSALNVKEFIVSTTNINTESPEFDIANNDVTEAVDNTTVSNAEERLSEGSLCDDMCRICHGGDSLTAELGALISACACRGTVGRVHVKCLERWLTESGKSRCELCGTRYTTRRVHKYGFPKALVMWFLSQNAKQLMVDSLGIMLMSPLAVFAAWLSGRTLSGLITQEAATAPWPLASTFVLACMTLVCYYCWIVSAASRHALGWWIWYRSQYEVRLQLALDETLD